jgi:hypothetical protein
MKRKRFSEEQIIGILKEHEAGVPVAELCCKHGVPTAVREASGDQLVLRDNTTRDGLEFFQNFSTFLFA